MLVSEGDPQYLELPRLNIEKLMSLGKDVNGTFVVPYKKGDEGWYAWQPIDRSLPASLWFLSMKPSDWDLLEKIRAASRKDWHVATGSPYPNRGMQCFPNTGKTAGIATSKASQIGTEWQI